MNTRVEWKWTSRRAHQSGDTRIVTTLCPGGKERMRRLMDVVVSGRVDLGPLVTHRFTLHRIQEACELFCHQRDGELEVAIAI